MDIGPAFNISQDTCKLFVGYAAGQYIFAYGLVILVCIAFIIYCVKRLFDVWQAHASKPSLSYLHELKKEIQKK